MSTRSRLRSFAWVACIGLVTAAAATAQAEETRVTNPSVLSLELLGRGVLWSVNFDRALNDDMAAGLGIGTIGTQVAGANANQTAMMIPAYFNYYLARAQGSVFVTGGAAIVANSGSVQGKSASISGVEFPTRVVLPQAGIGYENRGDSGYLFRVTAYGMYAEKAVAWVGMSYGYAF